MRSTRERELKLDVDGSFELPALTGEELPSRTFTSTYHDTPSRSLLRSGITLRRRLENGKSVWQLKLPRSDDARSELEEPGGPVRVPKSLATLLTAHLRHGALEPVATLRTRRAGIRVLDGERQVADVTVDTVDVLDAGRAAGGFVELEVELVDGDESDLERLGRRLRRAGAKASDGVPKLYRVLDPPAVDELKPTAPLRAQLDRLLRAQLQEIEIHDPGVRLGEEIEDVHRFRVATRRTRALIRVTRPLLGDALVPLGEELRWLAGVLGPVRDLDVLLEHLRREVATLGADERSGRELLLGLETARAEAREQLLEALGSPRYRTLLDLFAAAIGSLPPLPKRGSADELARGAFGRLRRAAAKLPDEPSDQELHGLRIRAKRARYAAELAALGSAPAARRAVDALKHVQDVIGTHQDAVVAEERLRALARARVAVAAGRLIERERERRDAMRAEYRDAVDRALRAGKNAFD